MREDSIKDAIKNMSPDRFERFAIELLRQTIYPGLNPTSTSHDLGEDAHTEDTTVFLHQGRYVSVFVSKTSSWSKLHADCKRCMEKKRQIDVIVYVTASDQRTNTEEEWRSRVAQEFGWHLEVYSLRWMAPTASRSEFENLVDEYLQVPPPGNDHVRFIEAEFSSRSLQTQQHTRCLIPGIDTPFTRPELNQIEDQLASKKPVMLTGEAGTGKSGIAATLAESACTKGVAVLFLDARRMVSIQDETQLRQYLGIKGSVVSAIERIGKYKGCRLIIDQLDSIAGQIAAQMLVDLAAACVDCERVEIVVVSRRREYHEEELLRQLVDDGFQEVICNPLDDTSASKALLQIGIVEGTDELVELAHNLLNLELIGSIKSQKPDFDFTKLVNETDLWEQYLNAILKQEEIGIDTELAEEIIDEATNLARYALCTPDRVVKLSYPRQRAHRRLLSWHILEINDCDDIASFRHDQFQYYLYAWRITRESTVLSSVINEVQPHALLGVFVWMEKIYLHKSPSQYQRFFRDALQCLDETPFYVRAAILDHFIQFPPPVTDPEVLRVILASIASSTELREYFFRSIPHPDWVPILWDEGYFTSSPSVPDESVGHYSVPHWPAQEYLRSVAGEVPEYVVAHVRKLEGHIWYKSKAVRALCYIPAKAVEVAIPRVVDWLNDPQVAGTITDQCSDLISNLAEAGHYKAAFTLFRELTSSISSSQIRKTDICVYGKEAQSKFIHAWDEERAISRGLALLGAIDIACLVELLENNLRIAIQTEATAYDLPIESVSSWWRTAIEQISRASSHYHEDSLLNALRDSLEKWVTLASQAANLVVERYLSEECNLLKRLGLHILHRFPKQYPRLVARELGRANNLDDTSIHHEFFLLLRDGFPHLELDAQISLIKVILDGPPPGRKAEYADIVKSIHGKDPEVVKRELTQTWIRDRLSMLREYLSGHPKQILEQLVAEYGEPDHPDFLIWSQGFTPIRDVSPLSVEQINEMPLDTLIDFLKNWRPETEQGLNPERISYLGMGQAVAQVFVVNLEKYAGHLTNVALLRPEYALVLVEHLTSRAKDDRKWQLGLNLCLALLENTPVRTGTTCDLDASWVDVRMAIIELLHGRLVEENQDLPEEYLPIVRDILLILIDDADPDPQADPPPWSRSGHNDPNTTAINHVRPCALSALIKYAQVQVETIKHQQKTMDDVQPTRRLESIVREALTRKLDRTLDPSWAVHSIYGRYLYLIYWLDKEWLLEHLNQIFPEADDEQLNWYFATAWDSFIAHNLYWPAGQTMLHSKYVKAIQNLHSGFVTQGFDLPYTHLALHLVWEYLLSDTVSSLPQEDPPLIQMFCELAPIDARGTVPWALWRIGSEHLSEYHQYWRKVRSLWEWRCREASAANHTLDYLKEMKWLAHLPALAPDSENISSLWPLLEAFLPYLGRSQFPGEVWDALEEYLAQEVERHPLESIQFHRLMYENATGPTIHDRRNNTRKIITTAVVNKASRDEALSLIDLLARRGHHQYRDIYEQNT